MILLMSGATGVLAGAGVLGTELLLGAVIAFGAAGADLAGAGETGEGVAGAGCAGDVA